MDKPVRTPSPVAATAMPTAPAAAGGSAAPGPEAARCAAAIVDVMPVVMRELRRHMREHLDAGLSVPQFRCLNYVSRQPGASISEVAGFLGVRIATASAMIDRLVRNGQMIAATSDTDRRRARLELSADGRKLIERLRRGVRRELARTLDQRPPDELQTVIDALDVLRHVFAPPPAAGR